MIFFDIDPALLVLAFVNLPSGVSAIGHRRVSPIILLVFGSCCTRTKFSGQFTFSAAECLTGSSLRLMSDEALVHKVEQITIITEAEPDQKEKIVHMLQKSGHTAGYIGDV